MFIRRDNYNLSGNIMKRKGQEEMVGFALILIVVGIVVLVFLAISLNKRGSENINSVETDSFVQSMLQYTSNCQDSFGNLSIKDLIFTCNSGKDCLDGMDSCSALNSTLIDIMNKSWNVGPENPTRGYELNITSHTKYLTYIDRGEHTSNSIGGSQDFSKGPESVIILMKIYS